eukprot:COSAG01_NODE_5891_length_3967_cov_16.745863_4_plen_101_part_00
MFAQFEPPFPGGFGFGNGASYTKTMYFSIVDRVQVPADLEKGAYALSFRYDCEQTSQVGPLCIVNTVDKCASSSCCLHLQCVGVAAVRGCEHRLSSEVHE